MINVNRVVYYVLVVGMLFSIGLYIFGLGLLVTHPQSPPNSLDPYSLIQELPQLKPYSVLMLAAIIQILTPVGRVVAALLAFTINRDGPYVAISGAVLAIIILGILLSLSGFSKPSP